MRNIIWFLKGKKTYIVIIITAVLALLQGFGLIIVPDKVWQLLLLAGGATMSAKINRLIDVLKSQ